MPQTKPIVSVENVVASASVDQKIDLIEVTKKFPDTEYHPEQFPGLVFRLKVPRTATLIFRTGKPPNAAGRFRTSTWWRSFAITTPSTTC